ncbi:hypothetical protein SALB1_0598 [Salinisphaera sp. LB1]|nr:hypothetical protein SALB1_0598 [Salinisphaera sp. LB1]
MGYDQVGANHGRHIRHIVPFRRSRLRDFWNLHTHAPGKGTP